MLLEGFQNANFDPKSRREEQEDEERRRELENFTNCNANYKKMGKTKAKSRTTFLSVSETSWQFGSCLVATPPPPAAPSPPPSPLCSNNGHDSLFGSKLLKNTAKTTTTTTISTTIATATESKLQ